MFFLGGGSFDLQVVRGGGWIIGMERVVVGRWKNGYVGRGGWCVVALYAKSSTTHFSWAVVVDI
jgi:hypothetical protein